MSVGWRVGGPAVGEPAGRRVPVSCRETGSRAGPRRPSQMSGVFLARELMRPVADGRSESVWADKMRSRRNLYFRPRGPAPLERAGRPPGSWNQKPGHTWGNRGLEPPLVHYGKGEKALRQVPSEWVSWCGGGQ